jgi:acyl-CoA thioesterase-1
MIIFSVIVVLAGGLSLAAWKMIKFKEMLNLLMNNEQWKQTCYKSGLHRDIKIIFFGDSQLEYWSIAPSFGTLPIDNKGISGDQTYEAINRFEKDVLTRAPQIIVLLIGTNDLGKGRPINGITNNIEYMVRKAVSRKINVILCSLLPVRGKHTKNHKESDLKRINQNLENISKTYCTDYVDFYSQLVDEKGFFSSTFTSDGIHPNQTGYMKMSEILFPYLMQNYLVFSKNNHRHALAR